MSWQYYVIAALALSTGYFWLAYQCARQDALDAERGIEELERAKENRERKPS